MPFSQLLSHISYHGPERLAINRVFHQFHHRRVGRVHHFLGGRHRTHHAVKADDVGMSQQRQNRVLRPDR
jgi:hypothetical protein